MLPCPTSTRPLPRALLPPSMAALTSRRPSPASYLEAPARGGEESAFVISQCSVIKIKAHHLSSLSSSQLGHSRLPDGLTRRGDINLLMLGDPGTAKSQLLKFVEKCSPIGVRGLRCPLVVHPFSAFCPLSSTRDTAVVTGYTCLRIHRWTCWQRCELLFAVLA